MKLPRNLYSRLTLITSTTLVVGYFVVYATYTTLNLGDATSWKPLTSTLMQTVMGNITDLNARLSNLSFSGGNVGIGTMSPTFRLDIDNTMRIQKSSGNGRIEMLGGSDGSSSSSIYMYNSSNQLNTTLSDGTYNSFLNAYGGNLGIGTTNPLAKITVGVFGGPTGLGTGIRANGSNDLIETYMHSDNAGAIQVKIDNNTATGPLLLNPNGGDVYMGTTSPWSTTGGNQFINSPSWAYQIIGHPSSAGNGYSYALFQWNGTNIGGIGQNGTTGVAYNTTSDKRLKENFIKPVGSLEELNKINVYKYNYKADPTKTQQMGFIAQELYDIYPQAVTIGGTDPKIHPWSVDYSKVVPLLTSGIQELKKENDAMKTRNNELEKRLEAVEKKLSEQKSR